MINFLRKLFAQPDNTQLTEAIRSGALLVDVRTPAEFAGGSAKGAVNIPLDKITGQLATLKQKKAVVVFCRSGNRSSMAQSILQQNGISNVINGGTWQNVASAASNQIQ